MTMVMGGTPHEQKDEMWFSEAIGIPQLPDPEVLRKLSLHVTGANIMVFSRFEAASEQRREAEKKEFDRQHAFPPRTREGWGRLLSAMGRAFDLAGNMAGNNYEPAKPAKPADPYAVIVRDHYSIGNDIRRGMQAVMLDAKLTPARLG